MTSGFPKRPASSPQGAEVLFYPTAIGYLRNDPLPYTDWLNAWITIQRGHAIANSVHVAVVNRVGTEGKTILGNLFRLQSRSGKFLKKAGTEEEVLIADIDISQNARIREGWRFIKNRRPDTYASLTEPVRPDLPSRDGYIVCRRSGKSTTPLARLAGGSRHFPESHLRSCASRYR